MADMRCVHDRLDGSCEDCAFDAAKAAGLPLGGPRPEQTRRAAQQAADAELPAAPTKGRRRS